MSHAPRSALSFEWLEPRRVMAAPAPSVVGTTMFVHGTDGADDFQFVGTSARAVRVNGASYAVPAAVQRIVFNGGAGSDAISAWIDGAAELRPGQARLLHAGRETAVEAVETMRVYASAAAGQTARLYDSSGADTFSDRGDYARMFGTGYNNIATGFTTVTATSSGHSGDVAWLYNIAGAHVFSGRATSSRSFSATHDATAFGFRIVYARAGADEGDVAELHGDVGDDRFTASPAEARLWGAGFYYSAMDFDRVVGRGGPSGNDTAELLGSPGADELVAWPIFTRLTGAGYSLEAKAFDEVRATSLADARDTALLYGGEGFDLFTATPATSTLEGHGVRNIVTGFEQVTSRSSQGGGDRAEFRDSSGMDVFERKDTLARLTGAGYDNRALGYNLVDLIADQGGHDEAWLTPIGAQEISQPNGNTGALAGGGRSLTHVGVEHVHIRSATPATISPTPTFELTYHEPAAGDPLALGSGVAFPWKLLPDPQNPGVVLAITGEGEQGGASFLYRLDATTLAPIGAALPVGASASDIAWVGRKVVVTARNSAAIVLVDVDNWRVADQATVFEDPIAVAALGGERVVVASIRVKELQIFATLNGELTFERKIALPGIAYDVTYDWANNRFYVNLPSIGQIVEIDGTSGALLRQHNVGGEPSYGGAIMGRYYIASDRDGYVHFFDRDTGAAHRVDLHTVLGLNRATAPVRGIDPTDLVPIDAQHFAVINQRQDSVLLRFNASAAFATPVLRARFVGAAFGTGAPPAAESAFDAGLPPVQLLLTSPSLHRVERITLAESAGNIVVTVRSQTTGITPTVAVRIGSGPGATLAVLTSDSTLHLVSEFSGQKRTLTWFGQYRISARHPMTADEYGRLWVILNEPTGMRRRLVSLDAEGNVLSNTAMEMTSPYSIVARHDTVVVVDRTRQQIATLDVPTGALQIVTLPNERPRHAEILSRGEWLVIHDTNPHLGVTHSKNGVRTFQPYTGGRWLAASTLDASNQPVFVDFNGRVVYYDVATRTYRTWLTLAAEPALAATFANNRLWVVSPADSTVTIVRAGATTPETVWTDARAFDVVPAEGGAWLVTGAGLVWRNLFDLAWRL